MAATHFHVTGELDEMMCSGLKYVIPVLSLFVNVINLHKPDLYKSTEDLSYHSNSVQPDLNVN